MAARNTSAAPGAAHATKNPEWLDMHAAEAGAIDALRGGDASALPFIAGRIAAHIDTGNGGEALRKYEREMWAALARGEEPATALGLPPPHKSSSQDFFERDNDAALYFHVCAMRGLSKRDAKARTADAFNIENVDRVIRGTKPPALDGPDSPAKYATEDAHKMASEGEAPVSGNHWDRYFVMRHPNIWKRWPLPQKPAKSQDNKLP